MDAAITQLGVGGIFALLVIREVMQFVSKRKNGLNGKGEYCEQTYRMTREIHDWQLKDQARVLKEMLQQQQVQLQTLVKLVDNFEKHCNRMEEKVCGRN